MRLRPPIRSAAAFAACLALAAGLAGGCRDSAAVVPSATDADASGFPTFVFDTGLGEGNAEIPAAVPARPLLLLTNSAAQSISFLDISDFASVRRLRPDLDLSSYGEPTSVAVRPDGRLAVVAIKKGNGVRGLLLALDLTQGREGTLPGPPVEVGYGPDKVCFTPDGQLALVADEGEPGKDSDPPGSVSFVRVSGDGQLKPDARLVLDGSAHPGLARFGPADVEPEYIAVSPDGSRAYVTLQENNAVAVLDISARKVADVWHLGEAEHPFCVDPAAPEPVFRPARGRREPDGIAVTPDGRYIVTANEGDTDTKDGVFSGTRDIAVWGTEDGRLAGCTEDQFERMAAAAGLLEAGRALERGIEPEDVCLMEPDGRLLAFVGLERAASVAVVDLSDPRSPRLERLARVGKAPEGICAVPDRKAVAVACEGDGTVAFLVFPG